MAYTDFIDADKGFYFFNACPNYLIESFLRIIFRNRLPRYHQSIVTELDQVNQAKGLKVPNPNKNLQTTNFI